MKRRLQGRIQLLKHLMNLFVPGVGFLIRLGSFGGFDGPVDGLGPRRRVAGVARWAL